MDVLRKEYPRPAFRRQHWQSLNGMWDFSLGGLMKNEPGSVTFDKEIRVPFAYQTELSGIGDKLDTSDVVWYRRSVSVPEAWDGQRVFLNIGASDYETTVFVNGLVVGSHRGGYVPFAFDITDYLKDRTGELVIKVVDENRTSQPRGKQSANYENWGCWYTRITGIWQSVWLEPVADVHLQHLRVIPNIDEESVFVEYELNEVRDDLEVRFRTCFAGSVVNEVSAPVPVRHTRNCDLHARRENSLTVAVPDPELWSPENPNLYDLQIELLRDGQVIDQVETYFGMRKVESRGNRIYLNNRPYYLRMVLDQGFWPEGIYTPGTVDEIKKDVDMMKEAGFNGARKHQKIEDPYFYHYCDTEGLLVWAEMPSCYVYDEYNVMNIMQEWQRVVRHLYNYPSIMAWVPMNESWGVEQFRKGLPYDKRLRFHLDAMYNAAKALDPHRLVISNDGWQLGVTDIIAIHDYTQDHVDLTNKYNAFKEDRKSAPFSHGFEIILPEYEYEGQPILVTEYGGVKVESQGAEGWGYGQAAQNVPEMLERMKELTDAILNERELSGYCYTQLTDVQQEVNGLFSFDRETKAPLEDYAEVFGRNPDWWPRR